MNVALGPTNTSSSSRTPSHSCTPHLTVTRSPTTTSFSTKTPSQMLQSAPMRAPGSTWANAQMRVPAPTLSVSQRPCSWTKCCMFSPGACGGAGVCCRGKPLTPVEGAELQGVQAQPPGTGELDRHLADGQRAGNDDELGGIGSDRVALDRHPEVGAEHVVVDRQGRRTDGVRAIPETDRPLPSGSGRSRPTVRVEDAPAPERH